MTKILIGISLVPLAMLPDVKLFDTDKRENT